MLLAVAVAVVVIVEVVIIEAVFVSVVDDLADTYRGWLLQNSFTSFVHSLLG